MAVWLIEDDEALGGQIHRNLGAAGYPTVWFRAAPEPAAVDAEVRAVVLDLRLPGRDGLDWLREVRPLSDVPVVVLSARAEPQTRVRALQLGADDYLVKPFWPEELLERLRARLRRPALARDEVVRFGRSRSIGRRARCGSTARPSR